MTLSVFNGCCSGAYDAAMAMPGGQILTGNLNILETGYPTTYIIPPDLVTANIVSESGQKIVQNFLFFVIIVGLIAVTAAVIQTAVKVLSVYLVVRTSF